MGTRHDATPAADPDAPFERLKPVLRAIFGVWWRYMLFAVGTTILFGVWPPVAVVALMFTVLMPILMLVLWGRSLDEEMGWGAAEEHPW